MPRLSCRKISLDVSPLRAQHDEMAGAQHDGL